MKTTILSLVLLLLFVGCNKDDDDMSQINCPQLQLSLINYVDEELNNEVNKLSQDLFPTPTDLDEFGQFENLKTLVERLNANCPQLRAELFCYACIETFPVQSEILVNFNFLGINYERIIDISTPDDAVLRSLRAHETRSP